MNGPAEVSYTNDVRDLFVEYGFEPPDIDRVNQLWQGSVSLEELRQRLVLIRAELPKRVVFTTLVPIPRRPWWRRWLRLPS